MSILKRFSAFMRARSESHADYRELPETLLRTMSSYSALSRRYLLISFIASAIASLGLMANSSVAIVGAMLVAPLMKPIMSLSYSMAIGSGRLATRSVITLLAGCAIALATSFLLELWIDLKSVTVEITSRTRPNLLDLGIAIAAGMAAALATTRTNVADSLPGVAIAVAILPPLCVAGIGFSLGTAVYGWGAVLLFAVNLIAILLAATLMFLSSGYGRWRLAAIPLTSVALAVFALALPLLSALERFRLDDRAQAVIEGFLHEEFKINGNIHPNDLSRVDTLVFPDHVFVFMEIKTPNELDTGPMADALAERLRTATDKPLNLKIQHLLTREDLRTEHFDESGEPIQYGSDDIIPRR